MLGALVMNYLLANKQIACNIFSDFVVGRVFSNYVIFILKSLILCVVDSAPGKMSIPISPNCTEIYKVRYNNSVNPFQIKVSLTKSRIKGELRTHI